MLSDNIRIIRKNKGYSQEELADKIHVTRQTLSKWENGLSVPDIDSLKQIASIFDISIQELVDGNAEKIIENEVIIDQLSRINEQLIISNKKSKERNRSVFIKLLFLVLVILLIVGILILKNMNDRGYKVLSREHLSTLTYNLPYNNFYHNKNDVAVTHINKDECLITGKCYRNYDDRNDHSDKEATFCKFFYTGEEAEKFAS